VLNVAIVGRPNVGKSSILNMLVQKNRALVAPDPGTTRDSVDEIMNFKGTTLRFIDTAGLRKKKKIRENVEFYSLVRTERAIKHSTVTILVIDSTQGITTQDKKIASIIDREKKGFVIAANKWDIAVEQKLREDDFIKDFYYDFPHVLYADIVTISALTGYNKIKLLKIILKVYNNYYKKIGTGNLNTLVHSLQGVGNDIKYGYQKSAAPHSFEFFVRETEGKGENFKRYLVNSIRKRYNLRGVPIEVSLRKR
jgi:GTP-binding protein